MPKWLQTALFWTLAVAVLAICATVPVAVALWAGGGWALISAVALALLIAWASSGLTHEAPVVVLPCWAAIALGLVVGWSWLFLRFIGLLA